MMMMIVGERYNWKSQPERLVYLGQMRDSSGWWHEFAKVESPETVWCQVRDSDLQYFEKTTGKHDLCAFDEVPPEVKKAVVVSFSAKNFTIIRADDLYDFSEKTHLPKEKRKAQWKQETQGRRLR